jgi:hypothetical protein
MNCLAGSVNAWLCNHRMLKLLKSERLPKLKISFCQNKYLQTIVPEQVFFSDIGLKL